MFESLSEVQPHLRGSSPVVEWGNPVSFFMITFSPLELTLKCPEIFSAFGFILAFLLRYFFVCSLCLEELDLLP